MSTTEKVPSATSLADVKSKINYFEIDFYMTQRRTYFSLEDQIRDAEAEQLLNCKFINITMLFNLKSEHENSTFHK